MLSKEQGVVSYDWETLRVVPDRLTRKGHAHYVGYAERMLTVYQRGVGRVRRSLHADIHEILSQEPDCPVRRVQAFCKLLDDASVYQLDPHGKAAELRQAVFRRAARQHPLVTTPDGLFEHAEAKVKEEIAAELGYRWEDLDFALFADLVEFQRLLEFHGAMEPSELLSRYNVAQSQVALYDAVELVIRADEDFKRILRAAKLAQLMHSIRRLASGSYEIRLDGPASVLRHTRRYGVAMARFLPTLLACQGWSLEARIRSRTARSLLLQLSPADGLRSHLPETEEFDSEVERKFAEGWGAEPRDGWMLYRETTVLSRGQKVFVPDFEFRHADGRRVLLEVVGYWTPEYLQAKEETLRQFADVPILLAIAHSHEVQWQPQTQPIVRFKTVLKVNDVLQLLQQVEPKQATN